MPDVTEVIVCRIPEVKSRQSDRFVGAERDCSRNEHYLAIAGGGGIVLSKPALLEPPGATVPVKEDAGFTAMVRHPEEK